MRLTLASHLYMLGMQNYVSGMNMIVHTYDLNILHSKYIFWKLFRCPKKMFFFTSKKRVLITSAKTTCACKTI